MTQAAPTPHKLEYCAVTKRYGSVVAVDDVSLRVGKGEVIALLGPSGSGKTTLLAMTGGQFAPDQGDILLDGRSIVGLPPNRIDAATVFQDYALFPHLSVAENVGFGLYMRRLRRDVIAERVAHMLDLVGLAGLGNRKMNELSGGQSQRVATARALVVEPSVLLMDEPLSALDREIRKRLQDELSDLVRSIGVTTVIVTHDQEEAFAMADRIAVMCEGRIDQVGTPEMLYRQPATPFVAMFLGSGVLIEGVVAETGTDASSVMLAGTRLLCRGEAPAGSKVTVLIRAEDVILDPVHGAVDAETWSEGRVIRIVDSGEVTRYTIDLAGTRIASMELGLRRFATGDSVSVAVRTGGPVIVTGGTGA